MGSMVMVCYSVILEVFVSLWHEISLERVSCPCSVSTLPHYPAWRVHAGSLRWQQLVVR
jgi:hypothetical protein